MRADGDFPPGHRRRFPGEPHRTAYSVSMSMTIRRTLLPAALLLAALAASACSARPGPPREGAVVDARRERASSFPAMIEDLATVRMVFVGESHTSPEHHEIQRRIVDELSRRNPHVIVGMEMLQRPYQEVLDRWSAGLLSEDAFLREVSWFDQWGDWDLYAPILRLCRDRRLKVVGLHLPALGPGGVISREISRVGLENLPPWMRARLPDVIDTSVKAHEREIRKIFFAHPGMEKVEGIEDRFRRFYQSQCTWDETMAESAVQALAASPHRDAAVVVLAGSMHVADFHSIPERARRRNGLDYRVVLPLETPGEKDEPVVLGPGRPGDWLLYTGPSPNPSPARLGVGIRGGDNLVTMVAEKGAAAEAGLAVGDLLVGIDGFPVRDLVDVKVALDSRVPGDTVVLRWTRGGEAMEGKGVIAEPPSMMGPVRAPQAPGAAPGAKPGDAPAPAPAPGGGGDAPPK